MRLSFWPKQFNAQHLWEAVGHLWAKVYRLIFFLLLLGIVGWGVFLWHQTLYDFQWSEEEKRQYMLTQSRQVNFREQEFSSMFKKLQERTRVFDEAPRPARDIFIKTP